MYVCVFVYKHDLSYTQRSENTTASLSLERKKRPGDESHQKKTGEGDFAPDGQRRRRQWVRLQDMEAAEMAEDGGRGLGEGAVGALPAGAGGRERGVV